jgi:KUP system potassium uptake protein
LIPNQQAEDVTVSHYKLESPSNRVKRAHWIKEKMESSANFKVILFLVTILATSMVIGDGVLTPCISGELPFFEIIFCGYKNMQTKDS